ncbi:MAG: NAD(P)/FAD-dependent oxidoreductase [Bdellovibrionales bacterium]|nr:NAD(P)/FAD-dependent oxidoreductase [Bdellovibrionales bacterium]
MKNYDAVVVGSGPNGLAAAITLARAGLAVKVFEKSDFAGGGLHTAELTLPGFLHDVCSAVHPLAVVSPFFKSLPLAKYGLRWVHSPLVLAHPLLDDEAIQVEVSPEDTAQNLGDDAGTYLRFIESMTKYSDEIFADIFRPALHWPRFPAVWARFGMSALMPAKTFSRLRFRGSRARALFAGIAAHSNIPLDRYGTTAVGLMLNMSAHMQGWPIPAGGAREIARAMVAYFQALGGEVELGYHVSGPASLPASRYVFLDLTPRQILHFFGQELHPRERRNFSHFRYGPGVFKVDWALSQPIPWKDLACFDAATVHLGNHAKDIFHSEEGPARGEIKPQPFVLLSQPSLFDKSRAPEDKHVAWAYCHVPQGSQIDATAIIENQIERFAPGFKKAILARSVLNASALEKMNPNLIGGDISGGDMSLKQLLFRPGFKLNPYRLDVEKYYICSSSTPPGPGVHGMCGFNAAQGALGGRSLQSY